MIFTSAPKLNLAQQLAALRCDWPEGEAQLRNRILIWTGFLTPSPVGRIYKTRLTYTLGQPPNLFVLSPSLRQLAGGRHIPHLYSQEREELCVYLPRVREWSPALPLSRTVLPWAVLWLYFFEDWLITDYWNGGGEHPRVRTRKSAGRLRS